MRNIKGFTMSEVIVVVAVLAIVFTIAMPDMNRLFARQSEIKEESRLRQIHEALDVYAKKYKRLPSGSNWYSELAPLTELSEEQIQKDVWNHDRQYTMFFEPDAYLGGSYDVYYATVRSAGIDGEPPIISLPTNSSAFGMFDLDNSNDFAIKYTDRANKLELLDETFSRIDALSYALEKYARARQVEGVVADAERAENYIYFPNDGSGGNGDYFTTVETISSANEATALATVLGMPQEYGQNALTGQTMWYVSNPGVNGSCSGGKLSAPYYPPILSLSNPC